MFKGINVSGKLEDWGGRRATLKFDRIKYEAPNRVVNTTEINSRGRLLLLSGFSSPVVECTKRLNANFPEQFARANGTYKSHKEAVARFLLTHRGKDVIYRPQLPKGVYFDGRGINMLLDMQKELQMSIVTIPELPDVSAEQYVKFIGSSMDYVTKTSGRDDLTFMPYIEAGMNNHANFDARFTALMKMANDRKNMAVGVRIGDYDGFRSNYMTINEHNVRSKDVWVHGSGSFDFLPRGSISARQHVPQRFGVDTAALMVKTGSQSDKEIPQTPDEAIDDALSHLRFFDKDTIEYRKGSDYSRDHLEAWTCDCPVCGGNSIMDNLRRFVNDEGGVDQQNLRDYVRLHNAHMSAREFEVSQQMTSSNELRTYFKDRKGLNPFV